MCKKALLDVWTVGFIPLDRTEFTHRSTTLQKALSNRRSISKIAELGYITMDDTNTQTQEQEQQQEQEQEQQSESKTTDNDNQNDEQNDEQNNEQNTDNNDQNNDENNDNIVSNPTDPVETTDNNNENNDENNDEKQTDAPPTTDDNITLGDYVELSDGIRGIIKFIGATDFAKGELLGLEMFRSDDLDDDGSKNGKQYFECKPGYGHWTRREKIKLHSKTVPDNIDELIAQQEEKELIAQLSTCTKLQLLSLCVDGYILKTKIIPNEVKKLIINYMKYGVYCEYSEMFCGIKSCIHLFDGNMNGNSKRINLATSKLYEFDSSKCIQCGNINCLEFYKSYSNSSTIPQQKQNKCYLYLNSPTNIRNQINEYQCNKCNYYIGHNLVSKKWYIYDKDYDTLHEYSRTFSPIENDQKFCTIENAQKFEEKGATQKCDQCKKEMKCIYSNRTSYSGVRGASSESRASYYCVDCQLFCWEQRLRKDWY